MPSARWRTTAFAGLWIGMASLACACGDDSGSEPVASSGSGGGAGTGTVAPDKLVCVSEVCELPPGLTGKLCCHDPFRGGCGIERDGSCWEFPKADARCPKPDLSSLAGIQVDPGKMGVWTECCAGNNQCGIDFGMGCTTVEAVCAILPKFLTNTLRPATCDGMPLTLPPNCGTDDNSQNPLAGRGG